MTDDDDCYVFIPKSDDAYPREVATPERRTVESWEEFKEFFQNQKDHTSVFVSLYGFRKKQDNGFKPQYNTAKLETGALYFDLDPEIEVNGEKKAKPDECWKETKKLHRYLKKQNIRHNVVFSGGGFHIYVYTNSPELMNKKATLYNAVMGFVDELELDHVDSQTVGDFSRITRVPNSWNFKEHRQLFCIPLGERHISMTYSEIQEEAEDQNFDYDTWGEKKLDLNEFDSESVSYSRVDHERPEFSKDYEVGDLQIDDVDVPRCIQRLLEKGKQEGHLKYRDRFIILTWFKERGLSKEATDKCAKKHFKGTKSGRDNVPPSKQLHKERDEPRPETDYEHMMDEYPHKHGMIGYIWKRRKLQFPSHRKLVNEGYCEPEWGECQDSIYWDGSSGGEKGEEGIPKLEGYEVNWEFN